MTKHTRVIGNRLIGSLRNENIVVKTDAGNVITLLNARTNERFAQVADNNGRYILRDEDGRIDWAQDYAQLVRFIKDLDAYPAPKERARLDARPRVRTAPKHMGVSMGHFVPGNVAALDA